MTFWSEIGSGFGEPGGIPPPRIPRSIPRDSRQQEKPNGEDNWMLAKFYILWLEHKFEVKKTGQKTRKQTKQKNKGNILPSNQTSLFLTPCLASTILAASLWETKLAEKRI